MFPFASFCRAVRCSPKLSYTSCSVLRNACSVSDLISPEHTGAFLNLQLQLHSQGLRSEEEERHWEQDCSSSILIHLLDSLHAIFLVVSRMVSRGVSRFPRQPPLFPLGTSKRLSVTPFPRLWPYVNILNSLCLWLFRERKEKWKFTWSHCQGEWSLPTKSQVWPGWGASWRTDYDCQWR